MRGGLFLRHCPVDSGRKTVTKVTQRNPDFQKIKLDKRRKICHTERVIVEKRTVTGDVWGPLLVGRLTRLHATLSPSPEVPVVTQRNLNSTAKHMKKLMNLARRPFLPVLALLGMLLAGINSASAAAADPTTVTGTATTAFEAVSVLVVAVVSFYIIVKIVRGIKGR